MKQHPPPTEQAISSKRLQDKADILENNLFNTASKQEGKINIHFQIPRKQFPDTVIIKALSQLFPRLNIKGPQILISLKKIIDRTIPEGNQIKIEKQLLNLGDTENPDLSRFSLTLNIVLTSKLLLIAFKGTPAIPSQDGTIAEAFFDSESCPGVFHKNGVIDFREINKFPIVKAGAKLFFITPESQGKPGMQYDGQIIPVLKALPLELTIGEGVERVEHLDKKGQNIGYFLIARKTGVVLLTRAAQKVTSVGISDELDVKRLDYSTGNIGTKFICPISMKIDTICSGFKIRARGMVEANVLEGGEIETDRRAQLHTILPGSRVTAQEDISLHFSRNAILTSKTGCITISDELMDSTLFSTRISFEKNKGTFTNNILDAEIISLKNVYFCGENTIYFGRRLFSQKQELLESRECLEMETLSLGEQKKELMENFHHELKRLTNAIKKNPLLLNNLKNLILATRTMEFETIETELKAIEKRMNIKEVSIIKKRIAALKLIPEETKKFEDKEKGLIKNIKKINQQMSVMSLNIEGLLRRAATLQIFTGAVENDPIKKKPEVFIESERSEDTFIKINCTYTPRQGFNIIRS